MIPDVLFISRDEPNPHEVEDSVSIVILIL